MSRDSSVHGSLTRAVDRGANAAEEIHRAIACIPLDLLEHVDGLGEAVDGVRKLQDRSITAVYELVRGINHDVERVANDLMQPPRKARKVRKKPAGRARSTTARARSKSAG
jgi:hypothetical protein